MPRSERVVYFILAVALPVNLVIGALGYGRRDNAGQREMHKLARVVALVREFYVDGAERTIGYENLFEGALNGLLQHLDEHSAYFPPTAAAQLQALNRGEYGGIGVEVTRQDDRLTVVEVMPGGPAADAGVMVDDQLVAIDGRDVTELALPAAVKLIKGKSGSVLKLRVFRPAERNELDLAVVRRDVDYVTVRRVHFLRPGLAYLQLVMFNEKTYRDLFNALYPLRGETQGLILDLRDNPGGLLGSACDVSGLFLPDGTLIVTTVPRDQTRKEPHFAKGSRMCLPPSVPLVVLVNRRSASAAEILAGCLQDHGRATVVGERSYGKASVQLVIGLPEDESSIKLTTRHYYTPSGKLIHGRGIAPDIEVKVPATDEVKLYGQLRRQRADPRPDDVPDPQLDQATDVLAKLLTAPPPRRRAPATGTGAAAPARP